jgi:large subunit ribosomal protein L29
VKPSEIREKTDEELIALMHERADDLMHSRLQSATGVVENVRLAREARKDIARMKTILNERKRATAQGER